MKGLKFWCSSYKCRGNLGLERKSFVASKVKFQYNGLSKLLEASEALTAQERTG